MYIGRGEGLGKEIDYYCRGVYHDCTFQTSLSSPLKSPARHKLNCGDHGRNIEGKPLGCGGSSRSSAWNLRASCSDLGQAGWGHLGRVFQGNDF